MELEKILDDMSPEELEPRLELQILADPLNAVPDLKDPVNNNNNNNNTKPK
jgi:hypothetical protein